MIFNEQLFRDMAFVIRSDLHDLIVSGITTPDLLLDHMMTLFNGISKTIIGVAAKNTMQVSFIQP